MKLALLLGIAGLLTIARASDPVILSLQSNGSLTWTNSASNGTYRVEWAGQATGPWQRLDLLTNLSSIAATTSIITVQVPMFYRVLWLDAPSPAGTYGYSANEDGGGLVVTGLVTLAAQSNALTGTWSLRAAGPANGPIGPQIGEGLLSGWMVGYRVWLDLNPGWADNNVLLDGGLNGNTWTGRWSYSTLGGVLNGGSFTAGKVEEGRAP